MSLSVSGEIHSLANYKIDWIRFCFCGHTVMAHAGKVCMFCGCRNLVIEEEQMSRPQLDYFIGRVVERTSKTKDSHKIYLEHGVVIHSTRQLPDGLKGKKLQTIIYGE